MFSMISSKIGRVYEASFSADPNGVNFIESSL